MTPKLKRVKNKTMSKTICVNKNITKQIYKVYVNIIKIIL